MAHDGQRAAGQLVTHQLVDRQALDLLVVDEVVVILGGQLRQAAGLDQLLDLRCTGLLLGLLLLLAVELLIAGELLGLGLQRRFALRIVLLDLALFLQALLLLLLLDGLLGLLFVDQPGFEQLITEGKTHVSARLVVNSSGTQVDASAVHRAALWWM